jgi:hypothetical protein
MIEKELKKYIKDNSYSLPISYNEKLIFKKRTKDSFKSIKAKNYNDDSYAILKFYKAISRF